MEKNFKPQIYKGMIQYILESTNYTLKNIADLSDSSIKNIRSIYCDAVLPTGFSELKLVKLYQIIIELDYKASRDSTSQYILAHSDLKKLVKHGVTY